MFAVCVRQQGEFLIDADNFSEDIKGTISFYKGQKRVALVSKQELEYALLQSDPNKIGNGEKA